MDHERLWRRVQTQKSPARCRALLLALCYGCRFTLTSWQPSSRLSLRGLLGCLLRRSLLCSSFLRCCLLGGRLLCCFLNGQLFTSFGGFGGALSWLRPSWLQPFRPSRRCCSFLRRTSSRPFWPQLFWRSFFRRGFRYLLCGAFAELSLLSFLRCFLAGLGSGDSEITTEVSSGTPSSSSEEVSTLEVSTSSSSSSKASSSYRDPLPRVQYCRRHSSRTS